jgi:hypothetical protein
VKAALEGANTARGEWQACRHTHWQADAAPSCQASIVTSRTGCRCAHPNQHLTSLLPAPLTCECISRHICEVGSSEGIQQGG